MVDGAWLVLEGSCRACTIVRLLSKIRTQGLEGTKLPTPPGYVWRDDLLRFYVGYNFLSRTEFETCFVLGSSDDVLRDPAPLPWLPQGSLFQNSQSQYHTCFYAIKQCLH